MNPKISAVIPLYNAEKYIGACIKSILAQTMQEIEIIVVDDCGTDNSVNVVCKMMEAPGGERIRLVSLGFGEVEGNVRENVCQGR